MKLLVMVSRVPYPLEKGDKLRAYHQIKHLSKTHEVTLCCLSDEAVHPEARQALESICSRLEIYSLSRVGIGFSLMKALFTNKPFQVHYFYQKAIHRKIKQLIKDLNPDHIYCQLIRTAEYAKHEHGYAKTIDYMDAFSKGMERRVQKASFWKKPFVRSEFRRLLAYENISFEYFDHKTIISEQDRQLIYHPQQQNIEVIPNGVDTEFFAPRQSEKTHDLVFVGNMSYIPNVETARYLATELLPALQKAKPGATLLLSGANPAPGVKALANEHVHVSGWMEDIRDAYAQGRIFIAPMQIGTGLQNKLLEAMSMGIPCITSPLANNALGAEHERHLLVANDTEAWCAAVQRLLDDEALSAKLGEAGRNFVESGFNWSATTERLNELLTSKGN